MGIKKSKGVKIKKFRLMLTGGVLSLIALTTGIFIFSRWANAGSANLYPGSCLGSWQNPHLAQGRPETSEIDAINKENSAVFSEGGIKEIYCGSFNGDLSESEIKLIKSVTLKFSWLVSDEELTTATSSITIIQPPATSSEAVASNTNDVINQILNNIHADEVQLIISTTTPEITITANTPISEIATSSISETIPAAASSVSEITTATSSLDSPLSPTEDFLKVSYTLDGVNWQFLGMVNKNNWQNINFQIPVSQLEDVKKIQIKIESLPLVNKTPYVYLDGLALEVEYGTDSLGATISNFFSVQRPGGKTLFISRLYNRSPSGDVITSPVTVKIYLEDFVNDTLGCGESDYWGVAFRYKSQSGQADSNSKFVITRFTSRRNNTGRFYLLSQDLPPGEITQVGFSCWQENLDPNAQDYDAQENSIAGDLEIIDSFNTPIFKVVSGN